MLLSCNKQSGSPLVEGRTVPLQVHSVPILKEQSEVLQELLVPCTEALVLLQSD